MTFRQRATGRQTSRSSRFPSGDLYYLRHLDASSNSQDGAPRPRWSRPAISVALPVGVSILMRCQIGRGWREQGPADRRAGPVQDLRPARRVPVRDSNPDLSAVHGPRCAGGSHRSQSSIGPRAKILRPPSPTRVFVRRF